MASGGWSRSVQGSSDEVFHCECGICTKEGKHREAKTFCQNCESYLCSSCTDMHAKFPALRNHKTISTKDMKKSCDICSSDGKTKDAICFCKDCNAWLCDDCKKSHERFKDLRKHKLLPRIAMFQSDSTAPCDITVRLGQLSTKTSDADSYPNDRSETKPQSSSSDEKSFLSTQPSRLRTKPSTDSLAAQHSNVDLLQFKTAKQIKEINCKVSADKYLCDITGCCFMPGGELVLCDWHNAKIKLFDRSLSVVDSLDLPGVPWDVAVVDNSNVIVTLPYTKKLQFVQVLPSLKKGRKINVSMNCHGVAIAAGKIFVSCYDCGDNVGEIRVYDLEGRDLGKRLGINPDGSHMFSRPEYVAVSSSGDKIFVSDTGTNTVYSLTSDGKKVYQYRDDELRGPRGLLVDDNDNVIVCGYFSHTVQVITSAGKKHKTLLSSEDGLDRPQCVSFRPSDGTLVVGYRDSNQLLVIRIS